MIPNASESVKKIWLNASIHVCGSNTRLQSGVK